MLDLGEGHGEGSSGGPPRPRQGPRGLQPPSASPRICFDWPAGRKEQAGGEATLSNAIVGGAFALRACIVNFRTRRADIEGLPPLVARMGREVDAALRTQHLSNASPAAGI
jgi:hypothetical protein